MCGELRLWGHSEIMEHLGLNNRQRVNRLRQAPSLNFPEPIAELKMGPVWRAQDIEQWGATWPRRTGRLPKVRSVHGSDG